MTLSCFLRVQDEKGKGPYCQYYDKGGDWLNFPTQPTPFCDGMGDLGREYLYAFASEEQYERWFYPRHRVQLKDAGYEIVEAVALPQDVIRGKSQVAYIPFTRRQDVDESQGSAQTGS